MTKVSHAIFAGVASLSATAFGSASSQAGDYCIGFRQDSGYFSGFPRAVVSFNDGSGPAMFVGGEFYGAINDYRGYVSGVGRWDGESWDDLGGGVERQSENNGWVHGHVGALAVFDDGTGPAIFAGGRFDVAGWIDANNIAKWNGQQWEPLGSGIGGFFGVPDVQALAVFDDGTGLALYAGGAFTSAGGNSADYIAKWDGTTWSPLGSGMNNQVRTLAVFDDGSGPALYAGGSFTTAGGVQADRIAKWDGAAWTAVEPGNFFDVKALVAFNDGTGSALYASGFVTASGGGPGYGVAKWDGTSWTTLGDGLGSVGGALSVFDNGSGPALYASRMIESSPARVSRWSGKSWEDLEGWNDDWDVSWVSTLGVSYDGESSSLFIGGKSTWGGMRLVKWQCAQCPGTGSCCIAKSSPGCGDSDCCSAICSLDPWCCTVEWDVRCAAAAVGVCNTCVDAMECGWEDPGAGVDGNVAAFAVYDDGAGPALYVAGGFSHLTDGQQVGSIVKLHGGKWVPLANGVNGYIRALEVFDDGSGPALYAGGRFTLAGGEVVRHIAKWDGANWSDVGGGVSYNFGDAEVFSLRVYDDGGGSALYVGGMFHSVEDGNLLASNIARWDGASWASLGGGVWPAWVDAMLPFDPGLFSGGGPELYVGGSFSSAGGSSHPFFAIWNAPFWGSPAAGPNNNVLALEVFEGRDGRSIVAGGSFSVAGGVSVGRIVSLGEGGWMPLGSGVDGVLVRVVRAIVNANDGIGRMLYVGGEFTTAGGVVANSIARWDGGAWHAVGDGVSIEPGLFNLRPSVQAIVEFDDGTGTAVFVGGQFDHAGTVPVSGIARWRCRPKVSCGPGDLDGSGSVDGADLALLLAGWGECSTGGGCPGDLDGSGAVDGADLAVLLANWGLCR